VAVVFPCGRRSLASQLSRRGFVPIETIGLEGDDVVGQACSNFEGHLRIGQVRIRPDLRYAAPAGGSAEEAAGDCLVAKLSPPPPLGSEQTRDDGFVIGFLRVLAVKADFESQDGRAGCVLVADDLRLIVLPGRLVLAEPDLDAVPVARAAKLAQIPRHETPNGVGNVLEE
jgi:hypothetical protein